MKRALLAAFMLLDFVSTAPARGQSTTGLSLQATFGMALRDLPAQSLATSEGTFGVARAAVPLHGQLRLVGEMTLSSFASSQLVFPAVFCGLGVLCARQVNTLVGPGVATFSIGLQRQVGTGPLALLLTGSTGPTWIYRHNPGAAGAAYSFGGVASLMFPGNHVRPLIEATTTHLLGRMVPVRWLSGVSLGVAVR
jgi:hypothetical protein